MLMMHNALVNLLTGINQVIRMMRTAHGYLTTELVRAGADDAHRRG